MSDEIKNVQPASPERTRQRLVMCLDGTWNKEDSSTNVLQHFSMALDGDHANDKGTTFRQTRYYQEGVGTGALDSITGGGFGVGLEAHVRDAYNWLVAHYHGENDPKTADEIFLFGFSRGAYTARSLVGFIASCGLLRRGAPITVEQLWDNYCLIGRQREQRYSFWDRVFGRAPTNARRITDLVLDPWKIHNLEARRAKSLQNGEPGADEPPGQGEGLLTSRLNDTEKRLVKWSRRVRITYLGLYDTVGAIGVDALAIPGLKSQLAMHHNMRPTTIIQNCRHALAVDEHRSSFTHTPFRKYLSHGDPRDDEDTDEDPPREDRQKPSVSPAERLLETRSIWHQRNRMWERKFVQRWFIGAHSNVGGGYPDNDLAQNPLHWLLTEACQFGLRSEDFKYVAPDPVPIPNDSYAEFAKPFWTHIIRGKRYYRIIDPPPEPRAAPPAVANEPRKPVGDSEPSIHEEIDPVVLANIEKFIPGIHQETVDPVLDQVEAVNPPRQGETPYQPLNVIEYARRKEDDLRVSEEQRKRLKIIARQQPAHVWLKTIAASLILVLWATTAGCGVETARRIFGVGTPLGPGCLWFAAATFAGFDWWESRTNHSLALAPRTAWLRALNDTLYWLRSCGFLLFVLGFFTVAPSLLMHGWHPRSVATAPGWMHGWHAETIWAALCDALGVVRRWWPVPLAAGVALWTANLLDRVPGRTEWKSWFLGGLCGLLAVPVLVLGLVLAGRLAGVVCAPLFGGGLPAAYHAPGDTARLAGHLLLLQIAGACLVNTFSWVNEPMQRLHLGSVRDLPNCPTAKSFESRLRRWLDGLTCQWDAADGNRLTGLPMPALVRTLREALYRDMFGFIPLYWVVLTYGMWLAGKQCGYRLPEAVRTGFPYWILLPSVTLLADYGEDAFHLFFVSRFEQGRPLPAALVPVSFFLSKLKLATWLLAFTLGTVALGTGLWEVAIEGPASGWRGAAALLIAVLTLLGLFALYVFARAYRKWAQTQMKLRTPGS